MTTQKPAAGRLPFRAARTAFLALLLVGLPLAAQSRSSHGASGGGGRTAQPSGGSHSSGPSMRGSAPHSSGGGSGYSSSSGGRSAHEVPGGSTPHRQPSPRGSHGGGNWHGGHGGWYGGYYYPGWSWGFYPGFSWWWWNEPYDPYYYPSYRHYPYDYGYERYSRYDTGALDLDVSPGRTHVYIDGEDLGPVDRYDGWPGYLWLPRGTYDVAFYLDGFKTISRQITIYPGTVIDIDDRMEQGTSVRPEDLATKTHERRDDRLRYERQRRDDLDRQGYREDDDQDWHDRVRRDRDRDDMKGDRGDRRDDSAVREDRGSLRLDVDPDDASVYLDGRFVGTGSDLSMMQGGLSVAPGEHRLAIVRPGHKAEEQKFRVQAGQEIRLNIHLEDDSR